MTYAGSQYADEKLQELSSADIFVFPTNYPNECFPLVLLEAMQFALPIVTTDVGGINDIISNGVNGITVPVNDPEKLATAIEEFLLDPKWRYDMGKNGKRIFSERYNISQFEKNIFSIFTSATTI